MLKDEIKKEELRKIVHEGIKKMADFYAKKDNKEIDAMKERMLLSFLRGLEEISFVKETNSVTGESKELHPVIEDMEATIRIEAEFDREDLKDLLISRA